MRFSTIISIIGLWLVTLPAFGQAIVLRPDDTLPQLKNAAPNAFYVNGPSIVGMTDEIAKSYFPLGDSAKYMLALATLRLADKGVIDLDATVAKILPDLLEFDPFEVAITPKHLLSETAGFARPPSALTDAGKQAPLEYFLIKSRGAGQIAEDDVAGWHLLTALLEKATGQTLDAILQAEVLQPLGIRGEAFQHDNGHTDHTKPPLSSTKMSGSALAKIFMILVRNRNDANEPFLRTTSYGYLTANLWRLHPMAPPRTAGAVFMESGGLRWLQPRATIAPSVARGVWFVAFPREGVVFMDPGIAAAQPGTAANSDHLGAVTRAAVTIAKKNFPPFNPSTEQAAAEKLAKPSEIGGHFECADTSIWIQDRVRAGETCSLDITEHADGNLDIRFGESALQDLATPSLRPHDQAYLIAPYRYETTADGRPLTLSRFRLGGYALFGSQYFVRVDLLGFLRVRSVDYLSLVMLTLLTSALYARSRTSVQWRRFAKMGTGGTLLVAIGLYADWHWWPTVLYEMQMPWLITLWRTGLNIGLMLILALPMLAASFINRSNLPRQGFAAIIAGPHLGIISLASIALFLVTVIWGLAGTFSAY